MTKLDAAIEVIKNMSAVELTAALDELRRRQTEQRIAIRKSNPKCDACGEPFKPDDDVYDLAVSYTCREELLSEGDGPDWDPQLEGYICTLCWEAIPTSIRKALT